MREAITKPLTIMKRILALSVGLFSTFFVQAQEQHIGLSTAPRGGVIAADLNPAELSNMRYKYEVGIFALQTGFYNNNVKLKDISSMEDDNERFESYFADGKTADVRFNLSAWTPAFAMKIKNKWGVGLNMQSHGIANVSKFNPDLGIALTGSANEDGLNFTTPIATKSNQRITGASWSEVNLSGSRVIFENWAHRFNGGVTVKFLFPAIYGNIAIDKLNGNINYDALQDKYFLTGVEGAKINLAYSGSATTGNPPAMGQFGGIGADIGFSYQLKDTIGAYKVNAGMSIKNMGSMLYKSNSGEETFRTYELATEGNGQAPLDLESLSGGLDGIQQQLEDGGYITPIQKSSSQKVKLPTVFVVYADFQVVPKFNISVFTQQRVGDLADNYTIPAQNVYAVTPRFTTKFFDAYSTWGTYEISGLTGGFGLRLGGFYLGSNSVVTGLIGGKNIDLHMGARWAFGQ